MVVPDPAERPLLEVAETLAIVPLSERSFRRALEPGADLEHLGVRVGRRVFVKTGELRKWLGLDGGER